MKARDYVFTDYGEAVSDNREVRLKLAREHVSSGPSASDQIREVTGGVGATFVLDCVDFISEGGTVWPRLKAVAEANGCVPCSRS